MTVPMHLGGTGFGDALLFAAATLGVAGYLHAAGPLTASTAGRASLPRWRMLSFAVGLYAAAAALSSPVEHLAEELFVAHMGQHLALAYLAGPALVLGRPLLVFSVLLGGSAVLRSPPVRRLRRHTVRLRDSTAVLLILGVVHVAPWVAWHLPSLYEAATGSTAVHLLEHATLLSSGMVLTWLVTGRRDTLPAVATVAAGMVVMSAVAAPLTFGREAFYATHASGTWGLTRLADQQLGGALMWFPGMLPYLAAAGVLVLTRITGAASRPTAQDRAADQWSYR